MEINFTIAELIDIINEDVSRYAARAYSEDGTSLYDGIKITSRDKGVQSRMLEERDARVRDILAFCLKDSEGEADSLLYDLELGENVKSSTQTSLKVTLRKYLTEGVLFDWYVKHGIPTVLTQEGLEELETKLICMVRQGFIKKPLQPFGPAK